MKTKWILLAEDNSHDAELAKRALAMGEAQVEVIVARDGVEALHCLHHEGETHSPRGSPSVVLLDLKMPRVDGFEVLEEMKADERLKRIPIVIFTSSREERDVDRCYRLGASAYVVKPMDFRKYLATLKAVATFWTMTNEPPPETMNEGSGVSTESPEHHLV